MNHAWCTVPRLPSWHRVRLVLQDALTASARRARCAFRCRSRATTLTLALTLACARAPAGQVLAIMGPSGSGKTTMLDLLAGRRDNEGTQAGRILFNGEERSNPGVRAKFKASSGYMLQLAEAFDAELSLRENLVFSALMRLPASMPLAAKLERAEQVLDEIGLRERADVVVGSAAGTGGLSGGQKRLLMFGVEILSAPAILMLDEPTSGLDTGLSLKLMHSVKAYCAGGRSVIMTIHQPRQEIFCAFDLLLLMYKGSTAFFGDPLQGARYLSQFSSVIGGISIAHVKNPGDVVIDVLNQKSSTDEELGPDAVEFYDGCGIATKIEDAIGVCVEKSSARNTPSRPAAQQSARTAVCSYAATVWARQWAMQSRYLTGVSRRGYFSMLLNMVLIGSLFGYLFMDPKQIWILSSTLYQIPSIGIGVLLPAYVGGFFSGMRGMYSYENLAGCCSPGEFLLRNVLHGFLQTVLFGYCWLVSIMYLASFTLEFDHLRFGVSMFIFVLAQQAQCAAFMLFCCVCQVLGQTTSQTSIAVSATTTGVWNLFAGYFVPPSQVPPLLCWAPYTSPHLGSIIWGRNEFFSTP